MSNTELHLNNFINFKIKEFEDSEEYLDPYFDNIEVKIKFDYINGSCEELVDYLYAMNNFQGSKLLLSGEHIDDNLLSYHYIYKDLNNNHWDINGVENNLLNLIKKIDWFADYNSVQVEKIISKDNIDNDSLIREVEKFVENLKIELSDVDSIEFEGI